MPRIIQQRVTTIQIFSAEILWTDEESLDDSTVIIETSAQPVTPRRAAPRRRNVATRAAKRSRQPAPAPQDLTSK